MKTELVTSKKIAKSEHDAELTKSTPICTTSYPSFSCTKSRRNLTEVLQNFSSSFLVILCGYFVSFRFNKSILCSGGKRRTQNTQNLGQQRVS